MAVDTIKKHYLIVIFIFVYVVFAAGIFRQLPTTNDEEYRYLRGKELLNHFVKENFNQYALLRQPNQDNFIYSGYTVILNAFIPAIRYEYFHLLNFLFTLPLFIGVYIFFYAFSKSTYFSILTVLAQVFTPGFFGHVGINS